MPDTSLSEGISSKLSDLAPAETAPANDSITLARDGIDITIPRGGMSDEEWDGAVESARKKEGFKEASINGVRLTKSESSGSPSVKNPLSFVPSIMAGATDVPPPPPTPVPLPEEEKPTVSIIPQGAPADLAAPGATNQLRMEARQAATDAEIQQRMGSTLDPAAVEAAKQKRIAEAQAAQAQTPPEVAPPPPPTNFAPPDLGAIPNGGAADRAAAKKARELQATYEDAHLNQLAANIGTNEANLKAEELLRAQVERQNQEALVQAQERQARIQQKVEAAQQRSAELATRIEKESKVALDPRRYWKNQGVAGAVGNLIAAFCFGYTGQGMQFLQRLDGLVAQDLELQKADRSSMIEGLKDTRNALKEEIMGYREQGASVTEAYKLAREARLGSVQAMVERQARAMKNPEARANLSKMAAEIQGARAKNLEASAKDAYDAANKYEEQVLKRAEMGLKYDELNQKVQQAGQGKRLDESGASKLAAILNGVDQVKEFKRRYQKEGSSLGAGIASIIPGTESDKFDNARDIYVQNIGKGLEGGKLAEGDIKRYRDMLPGVGSTKWSANSKFEALGGYALQQYRNEYEAFKHAGRDVSQFPTPEQVEAELNKTVGAAPTAGLKTKKGAN